MEDDNLPWFDDYQYEIPEDLDEQTKAFVEKLYEGNTGIGPYGVKRDDSLFFVNRCLQDEPIHICVMADVDEFSDVLSGVL